MKKFLPVTIIFGALLIINFRLSAQTTGNPGADAAGYPALPDVTSTSVVTCGFSLIKNHVAGTTAPVTKTVTYATVANIPGELSKCWITSNLGADHQATAVNDATEASAGWYWQFNRKQGYKHDGTTITPAWTITAINENSNWVAANHPCAIELGNAWRIPTLAEWTNVDVSGGWTNWNGPWNSSLKMHAAGLIDGSNGMLTATGSLGQYWSSSQYYINNYGNYLTFNVGNCGLGLVPKAGGYPVRCITDQTLPSTQTLQNISVPNGQSVCFDASQTITAAGSGEIFTVQNGGSATLIAGQNIRYLPGTAVYPGGHLWGYIAPGGPYCQAPSMPASIATAGELPRFACAQASFDLYPNPTTGIFTLERTGGNPVDEIRVEIFGMTGVTVLTEKRPGAEKHEFSLADQPAGIYFVRVVAENLSGSRMIIVK